jgi:hypothetical protein
MSQEDYKKGYRDGFIDGVNSVKSHTNNIPSMPIALACYVCGMRFTDSMGRPIPMGYVCNNNNCPSKVTCVSYSY